MENDSIYEKCALCGKLTSVMKTVPVQKRYGYIEGFGQLCSRCYRENAMLSSLLPDNNAKN